MARHFIPNLIGRFVERRTIERMLEESRGGQGQLLLIQGLAGSGKSRLLEFAIETAQSRGFVILPGLADENDRHTPYGVLLDAFRRFRRGIAEGDRDAWLDPALRWTKVVTFEAGADLQSAQQAFEDIYRCLHQAKAVLLALEDLHWADEASLDVLLRLTRELDGTQICIIATCRTEGLMGNPDRAERIHRVMRQPGTQDLQLTGLTLTEVGEVVDCVMPDRGTLGPFVQKLYQRTEGNPLFIEEVLRRTLAENTGPEAGLPVSFQEALLARLPALSSDDLRLLKLASVVGERFDLLVLIYLARKTETDVLAGLTRLTALHLIRASEEGEEFRFWHALTRGVLYEQILVPDRRALHRRVAQFLLNENETDNNGTIADHLERAGEAEEAAVHYLLAAEQAESLSAFGAAFAYGERALGLKTYEPLKQANLAFRVSQYARMAGHIREALSYCEEAEALYETTNQTLEQAQVRLHHGDLLWLQGDGEQAMVHVEQAMTLRDVPGVAQDAPVWAWGLARLSQRAYIDDRWQDVFLYGRRGLAMARRLEIPEAMAHCLINMGVAYAMTGRQRRGLAFLKKARTIALKVNSPEEVSRSCVAEVDIWSQLGQYGEACVQAAEGTDYARKSGAPVVLYPTLAACHAEYLWLTGQWQAALDALPTVEGLLHEQPSDLLWCHFLTLRGRIETARDRFEEAERFLTEASSFADKIWESQWALPPLLIMARLRLAQQRFRAAMDCVVAAFERFAQTEHIGFAEISVVGLEAACHLNLSAADPSVVECCRQIASVENSLLTTWCTRMADGLHSILSGEPDTAVTSLTEAVPPVQEMGCPELEADTHRWLALALQARGEDADRREAARQRNLALELLQDIPGKNAPEAGALAALSNREREVALLMAEGLTNRQLAEQLFISERTVAVHVSHILSKLGLDSRQQVMALLRS